MAREPELSIKVKVDPQINPSSLKTSIERKVKQSGEKPQVEIDPNVDGIKGKIEDKLKNVKATAIVTPVVDTEKIKVDIQRQINGISDMPKVTVGVDVNNFSNELSEQLKTQLKEVNQQLSYYLKNLTKNTDSLNSFASDIFSTKEIKSAAKQAANEVNREFAGGLDKVFNVNDLFNYKISDSTKRRSIAQAKNLVQEIKDDIADLNSGEDNWTEDLELIPDNFNKKFSDLKSKALELRSIVTSFGNALNADEFKDILKIFNSRDYNLVSKTGSFSSLEEFLDAIISKGNTVFKTGEQATKFLNSLEDLTGSKKISVDKIFGDAFNELTGVQQEIAEINTDIKTSKSEIKDVQKSLQQSKNDDTSGYLDVSTIETYGNAIDRVLGNIAQKQEDINAKRQAAVNLEKNILSNTVLTREGLSHELEEYTKILNKFDTEKITKLAASLKDTRIAAEQSAQKELVQPVTQPSKKESIKFAGGIIPGFNDVLKNNKKTEETVIPVKGKVTITDADITVDVKNPVKIPSVAVIDSSAAQIGNTDDLKSRADALVSANESLNGISSKTNRYVSNISALGPAFQYVAQEVDNLSKSLENQIIDFDRISEQTNAYIGKASSILINTSNVAITGEPTTIDGKVILTANDIVPPEEPVDIKGHVELKVSDITPPSEPVELQDKIAKTTMESTAKGKKKKGQDVEKPDVIKLNGHVKLEDKDIERPDPVVMNGKVVVTKNNIKLPEGGIDVKGNLILKNAEIANAIKEAAGKESGKKNITKPKTDSSIIDAKAQQEANRLLQQEEQLQQKISDAAQKKADAENRSFNRDVAVAQKKYEQAELDNLKAIESIYQELTNLESKRGRYTKPEQVFDLHQIKDQISAAEVELNEKMLSASEVGYNPLKVTGIRKQALKYYYAQASSDNKFDVAKQQAAIKVQQEATRALQEETEAKEKAAEATRKKEEAENKLLSRDIAAQEKKDNSDGSKAIDDIVSGYQKIISLQKQKGKLVNPKDKEDLDEINKQLAEEETRLSELMFNFQDSTGVNPYQFTDVRNIANLAEKEYQSLNRITENKRNSQYQNLMNQLSDSQKIYGTVEDAEAADKIPTSIQEALRTQQQLITAIANTAVGTEEYNNAIKAAEDNWKNVAAAIEASNKAQRSLGNQTNTLLRKFELLKEEVSQSSNDELKNSIEGIITRARDLNAKDPRTYENYANDLLQLRQDSYAVQAKHTLWRKGYKGLEKKGNQIARGVEVARQMQEDGSLQGVDFKNIDELIAKLNTLPAQSDTYAETLKEIDTLWQEIKKKVDAVNESEKQAANRADTKISGIKAINKALDQNTGLMVKVRNNNGTNKDWYSQLDEKQKKLEALRAGIESSDDPVQVAKN